jgi:hypothetical protein
MRTGLTIALFFTAFCSFAQERLSWSALEQIDFTEVYDEGTASWVQVPQWTPEQRANWDGKEMKITGYAIVLDPVDHIYALSAFPFSSCFFCGAAGPESVMELEFERPVELITDQVITVIGTLDLNTSPEQLPITLLRAKLKE